MSRRTAVAGLLLTAGTLALTACQPTAGSAAFVGGQRITDRQLQAEVTEGLDQNGVRDAIAQQSGGDIGEFRRGVLYREIQNLLVAEAARRTGAAVPDAEVQQLIDISGGMDRIRARNGMSAAVVTREARDELLIAELGYTQGSVPRPVDGRDLRLPGAQQSISAAMQVGQGYLVQLAVELGVRTDPRYGVWNPRALRVDAYANPVVRLAQRPARPPLL